MNGDRLIRGDAVRLPLRDESVDLIVTSPPYFALRSYQDGGEHYDGQVGSEATPAAFLDALWACTAEWQRVLKPTGSIFVNLGDKYAGSGRGDTDMATDMATDNGVGARNGNRRSRPGAVEGIRPKSLMGLPWRYAIGCIDGKAGDPMVLRAEVVWSKPNGLPESVTDRVRRSHEQWFHLTREGTYYSAVDEIREAHQTVGGGHRRHDGAAFGRDKAGRGGDGTRHTDGNLLGKLPGSVWTIPTDPLIVSDAIREHYNLPDHFAAFPQEWPRRIILGWSPAGICVECGEGRRPVVDTVGLDMSRPQAARAHALASEAGLTEDHFRALLSVGVSDTGRGAATQTGTGKNTPEVYALADEARHVLGGYAREYLLRRPLSFASRCACPTADAPTRPAVVLDPFSGTGTVAGVARALGRTGIGVDLSHDYCRLAQWFLRDGRRFAKTASRTDAERQGALL